MLYLEELLDTVIAEEGQTLMGLDFLIETLNLPMQKIDTLFKKALAEYSERRPLKKTVVFHSFDYIDSVNGEAGYIKMPEGTTSCRVARYGVLPNQMPRYYMPKFGEQAVEFDIATNTCKVWPPVTPIRLTYTQRYVATTNILIEKVFEFPYKTDECEFTLPTYFAGKTLNISKSVGDKLFSMTPTGYINETKYEDGIVEEAILKGNLGKGTVNLKTREVKLELQEDSTVPLVVNYYPKYSVIKELDIGNYLFTRIFACKILQALASMRAQATQEKLHNISLDTDDLLTRVAELKKEIRDLNRSAISFGALAPQ